MPLDQKQSLPAMAQTSAGASTSRAKKATKTRRPIVPMTASEAIALVFVEFGLLILLADYSGLFLIAIGIADYLYARLTYKPPVLDPRLALSVRLTPPDDDHSVG